MLSPSGLSLLKIETKVKLILLQSGECSAVLHQTCLKWNDLVDQGPASSFRIRVTIAYLLFYSFSSL